MANEDLGFLEEDERLDVEVAVEVLGLAVEVVRPAWYPHPVLLFRGANGHLLYSYDQGSCNACMFANGVDDRDGTLLSLPAFSEELYEAWSEVLCALSDEERQRAAESLARLAFLGPEEAAAMICRAALAARRATRERERIPAAVLERRDDAEKD